MSFEENKALARVWFEEIMNNRNLAALEETYDSLYVHRGPDDHQLNRDEARETAETLLERSNDRVATVLEQIAEGDMVMTRWESRGTYVQPQSDAGAAPGRFLVRGVVISRIRQGRIIEDWEIVEAADVNA